jgi:hypothetical protein
MDGAVVEMDFKDVSFKCLILVACRDSIDVYAKYFKDVIL